MRCLLKYAGMMVALALLMLAHAGPVHAQGNECSGGAVSGMVVGGTTSGGACYYIKVNSDGSINTTASGSGTAATITPSATVGITTQSCTAACASTLVTGAHGLYGVTFSSTAAGWLLIYDATTCSANGTVTPKKAIAYPVANYTQGVSWADIPMINATGIAACFSTTGPYTATASTTAFISADYK